MNKSKSDPFFLGSIILGTIIILLLLKSILHKELDQPCKTPQIKLYWDDLYDGPGTAEHFKRVAITARHMGWEVEKYSSLNQGTKIDESKRNIVMMVTRNGGMNAFLNSNIVPQSFNKFLISWWVPNSINVELASFNTLLDNYRRLSGMPVDGYLITHTRDILRSVKEIPAQSHNTNDAKFFMTWYPTVYATTYVKRKPRHLMFSGSVWDPLRQTAKYRELYKKLANQGYFAVYGPEKDFQGNRVWDEIGPSYKGFLDDGVSFLNAMEESGITLMLHTQHHFDTGLPAARVFEGAAACAVMISDKHPFVEREFGDSVLYIDHTADAETMFKQIDDHMKWIKEHSKEVYAKTKKAHDIFMEKFTLESQMKRLENNINRFIK